MFQFTRRLLKISPLCCYLGLLPLAHATQPENVTASAPSNHVVEFDSQLLMPIDGQTVDVTRFRYGNPITAGEYESEVWVNGQQRGQIKLKFDDIPDNPIKGLCFTKELWQLLDLKKEALARPFSADAACGDITQMLPAAQAKFDIFSQRLILALPDILLIKRPKGYIPPSQWQQGVPAAFVKYQFNQYQYQSHDRDEKRRSDYLGLKAGVNVGVWSLRHSGSQAWQNGGQQPSYRPIETYVQRDIDAWNSRVMAGDFYTRSSVNENFAVRGVSLLSDSRMLPYSQVGYAPLVRGVAHSNARVRVRQNNQVIYETNVPAGSFEIDELSTNSYGTDLHVEILEADGSRREFRVPTALSSHMLRPKHWRYEFVFGRYREGTNVHNDNVAQAAFQYGLNNQVTLKTGLTASPRYLSGMMGAIYSNRLGTWESHLKTAQLKQDGRSHHAQALGLSYNKNFNETGTYVYLNWQQFFKNRPLSLSDAMSAKRFSLQKDSAEKYRYQISLNQKLGEKAGSLYLSGASSRYHGRAKSSHEYQVSYGNQYKNVNYGLGFSQSRDMNTGRKNNQIYANLSIPLGKDKNWLNHHWLDVGYQRYRDVNQSRVAMNGTFGDDGQWHYGVSGSHRRDKAGVDSQNAYSASLGYRASVADWHVNAGRYGDSKQWGWGVSGALVAHPRGLTLSRELGETFAVIHAKHAKGAEIRGFANLKLDRFGNGIVPSLAPYKVNHIGVNPENLPDDVELLATGKDVIPRAHSVNLVAFPTQVGKIHLFQILLADGQSMPPMAAEALDEKGQTIAYVVQSGQLMTRGLATTGKITLKWDEKAQCQFDYHIAPMQTMPQVVICHALTKLM